MAAWSAVVGTALSVAMLTGAITLTANLHRELTEPHHLGLELGPQDRPRPRSPTSAASLSRSWRRIRPSPVCTTGTVTQVDVSGARVDVLGLDPVTGTVVPTLVAGRAPRHADEIVLGARTMRALAVQIGDYVRVRIGTNAATTRVVGRAALPH